jgi:UDP-glucose 4-epimerase
MTASFPISDSPPLCTVTGANGFLGYSLCMALVRRGIRVRGAVRNPSLQLPAQVEPVHVTNLAPDTDWSAAVKGADTIVHTAARVHVMRDKEGDPLAEFRRVNVAGTLNLARQAAVAGVRRFIFISSIKVNGEFTKPGQLYRPDDVPAPMDAYGISKFEAEDGLRKIALECGLEAVIIRPVLVYGPGVKANFLAMMNWLNKGIPLPLGAIDNRRSFVALDNLVDLIMTCVTHPAAANQIFLVSDGEDLSTTTLLRNMAVALGKKANLVPMPASILRGVAGFLGMKDFARRLCESLQVDISKTRNLLGWTPPESVSNALGKTARSFLASHS